MDGFMALLVGQNVPYEKVHHATPAEHEFWRKYREQLAAQARLGMTSEQALHAIRAPGLEWGDPNAPRPAAGGNQRQVRPTQGQVPVIPPDQLRRIQGARPSAPSAGQG